MKQRPILFSGPMVRAILEGRKTQTRRVINPQPFIVLSAAEWHSRAMSGVDPYGCRPMGSHVLEEMGGTCPHGTVGDRLWVRETWMPLDADHVIGGQRFAYRAETTEAGEECRKDYVRSGRDYRWRPSIHMPRSASRITLEITGVRVERLQEISEADAIAEGVSNGYIDRHGESRYCSYGGGFGKLWQSINGPESWAANPWVWVIEFRRVQQ